MALKKEFNQNNPDNGVKGNYVKCVGVQLPQFDMDWDLIIVYINWYLDGSNYLS